MSAKMRWFDTAIIFAMALAVVFAGGPGIGMLLASDEAEPIIVELFDSEASGTTVPLDLNVEGDFPGIGDIFLENHDLFDVTTEEIVGSAITRLQVIRVFDDGDLAFLLDCTIVLADGTFHFTGGARFSELQEGAEMPIVGGTGVYHLAQGVVRARLGMLGERSGAHLTAEIIPYARMNGG